jgi:hypothetical protein
MIEKQATPELYPIFGIGPMIVLLHIIYIIYGTYFTKDKMGSAG